MNLHDVPPTEADVKQHGKIWIDLRSSVVIHCATPAKLRASGKHRCAPGSQLGSWPQTRTASLQNQKFKRAVRKGHRTAPSEWVHGMTGLHARRIIQPGLNVRVPVSSNAVVSRVLGANKTMSPFVRQFWTW